MQAQGKDTGMDEQVLADCHRWLDLRRRFRVGVWPRLAKALLRGQLNISQFHTLCVLDQTGETTMGKLAKGLGVTMGASTNVVEKLVTSGYVARTRSERDRRVVKVKLTKKGSEVLRESTRGFTGVASQILSRIDPEERGTFLKTYEKIVTLSEEIPDEEGADDQA